MYGLYPQQQNLAQGLSFRNGTYPTPLTPESMAFGGNTGLQPVPQQLQQPYLGYGSTQPNQFGSVNLGNAGQGFSAQLAGIGMGNPSNGMSVRSTIGNYDLLSAGNGPNGLGLQAGGSNLSNGLGLKPTGQVNVGLAGSTPSLADSLGFNVPTAQLGFDALKTVAGLYSGYKANKLANEDFNFRKTFALENQKRQTATYNDAIETREGQRGVLMGRSEEDTKREIERRRFV